MHLPSAILGIRDLVAGAAARASASGGPLESLGRRARRALIVLLCAGGVLAAGCHNNNDASGYGIAWVTLTDSPGDFTSYVVNIDSITLTRNDSAVVTALATVETVDFTKLNDVAELWGSATIPVGTYTSASIVLDYTSAVISVMVNGVPVKATVTDTAGAAVTTQTINVIFDPAQPLVIQPTYATTAAQRLALDLNLSASTVSAPASNPTTVVVRPYMTAAIAPPDNKMIRIRGPLINSSVDLLTYTVYVRPFFDEVDSLGSLSLFADSSTIFTINGVVSTGSTGLNQLSQSSAGTTVTAAYTTYTPTATPSATAGIYHLKYVVAGSSLEDVYTQGIEGDVISRTGNTLQLRGATVQFNDGTSSYQTSDATVVLGAATIVTADDDVTTGLNYNSVGVGQHIIARGICTVGSGGCEGVTGAVKIDATGSSATNTGSVRLISTRLYGSLVSSGSGSVLMNVANIENWPISDYTFTGNGATAPLGSSFAISTGSIALPTAAAGDPLFVDGVVTPFGTAPPDFTATTVNSELSVQTVGGATGATACGQGTLHCQPASLRAQWSGTGTSTPFSTASATGLSLNLSNSLLETAVVRIGSESIDLKASGVSPQIVPGTGTSGGTGLPPIYLPLYTYGNPAAVAPAGLSEYSVFSTFVTSMTGELATVPALQFEARGTYDATTNTFTASSVNVVL